MKRHISRSNKNLYLRAMMVALVSFMLTGVALGTALAAQTYIPNEFIIHTQSGTSLDSVKQVVDKMGAHVVASLPMADTYLIRMGRTGQERIRRTLIAPTSTTPVKWTVDHIQPNLIYKALAVPNDELWAKQKWDMEMIHMPQAWQKQKGSSTVIVAVNDTGVAAHPDLAARLLPGYDFIDGDADASPEPGDDPDLAEEQSHGTHVAGTIAAQGNNQIGVCGVCWDGVKILPVRVLGPDGGTTATVVSGLDFAMAQGAQVVNMSYGMSAGMGDDIEHAKLIELANAGIILVAAAGNDGDTGNPSLGSPAMYDETIAVASVGPYESIAPYSSYGPANEVDIAAPGGDANYGADGCIWSTLVIWDEKGNMYGTYGGYPWQGTSMACPHVAGAAALLLSAGVAPAEVRGRLISSARPPQTGTMDPMKYGAGILDVQAALADADIRIEKPVRSSTVGGNPEFKISLRGVDPASIKVYLDYADAEPIDGIPDNMNETPIIYSGNISSYLKDPTNLSFTWPLAQGGASLSQGTHFLYATATAKIGGAVVSDWIAFNVAGRVIPAGIHLFAFPFALNTSDDSFGPSSILLDKTTGNPVSFTSGSALYRYVTQTLNLRTGRLESKYASYPYDRMAWKDIADAMPDPYNPGETITWLTGGGYPVGAIGNSTFPAGSGFWLILSRDAVISDTYQPVYAPDGYNVFLYQGWNMIGNPYDHAVPWRGVILRYRGQEKSLNDAVAAGWVSSTLYGYKGGTNAGYERVSDKALLEPFCGYWLKANYGGTDPYNALVLTILP